MKRNARTVVVGLILAGILAACGGSTSPSGSPAASRASEPLAASTTQRSEGGEVTVVATWTGPAAGATIDIALDTHSVDLDALDLAGATLRNDRGETLTARPWAAPKGGHHREGALTFDGNAPEFFASAKWMELALTGVGPLSERTLRWEVGS